MGKVKAGGKAGVLAGLIYAVLEAVVVVTLLITFKSSIIKVIGSALPSGTTVNVNSAYNSLVGIDAAVAVAFGIIAGLALGLVFGAVSDRIPGQRDVTKGLVFGFVLWLTLHVIADYLENLKYGVAFYLVDIGLGLVTSLAYGALLGIFFEREMKKLASPSKREIAGDEEGPTQRSYATPPQQTTSAGSEGQVSTPVNGADANELRASHAPNGGKAPLCTQKGGFPLSSNRIQNAMAARSGRSWEPRTTPHNVSDRRSTTGVSEFF